MIGNNSENSSSQPCFACYNKTPFKKLIHCFQGEPKEFSPDIVKGNPGSLTQGHLMCMLFHREVEIISYLDPKSKKKTASAARTSKIKKDCYLEDCSICNRSHSMQCMVPCSMKNCEKYFHYECAFNSKDLKRLKILAKDHPLEMYGCSCTHHDVTEVEQHIKEQLNGASVQVLKDFSSLINIDLTSDDKLFSGETPRKTEDVTMDIETQGVQDLEPYNTFEDFLDSRNDWKSDERSIKEPVHSEQNKMHNQATNGHQMGVESQGEVVNTEKRELIFSNYLKSHEADEKLHAEDSPLKNDEIDPKGNSKRKKKGKK